MADGQFHSGTDLAKQISVSRSAVCKLLNALAEQGVKFNAVSGKGYCLDRPLQLLCQDRIEQYVDERASALISELEVHDCISSTNRYLVEKSQENNHHNSGTVCLAESQTAGKGRRGRDWVSPFGHNIYLSILWSFQNGPASISGLSLAVGVAVIRALNECGIKDVGLKWPNDIYWQEKKLAGILIEVSGEAGGPCNAVIGLGLNFYLSKKEALPITQDWVDLAQILPDNSVGLRNKLTGLLLKHLMPAIAYFEQDTLQAYLAEWRAYDCMQGKRVDIYRGKDRVSGVVQGIDNNGLLLLKMEHGGIQTFASGEVSFRQT